MLVNSQHARGSSDRNALWDIRKFPFPLPLDCLKALKKTEPLKCTHKQVSASELMKKKAPKRKRGRERSAWTAEDSLVCGLLASVYQSSLSINKSNIGYEI